MQTYNSYNNLEHVEIEKKLINKEFPFTYPTFVTDYINSYIWRMWYVKNVGYSLISLDWIIPLSKWIGDKKVLELLAGSGSLSYALRAQGINIITTDKFSWVDSDNSFYWLNYCWCEIEKIDALNAIEKYGKDVDYILVSWPPINEIMYDILLKARSVNDNLKIIYIGETNGGCTADDNFFNIAIEVLDSEFILATKKFQNFFGFYDKPILFK